MRRAFLYLLFINLIDYITTAFVVEHFGAYDIEANPLLLYLMHFHDSPLAIFCFKIGAITFYATAMYTLYKLHPERYKLPIWLWVVNFFNIAYTFVVLRSLYGIYTTIL